MRKNRNKRKRNETHTFRTFDGAESYFKEILGLGINENKSAVNTIAAEFIDNIIISDTEDLMDHRIFINNKKIAEVEDEIDSIDGDIEKLKNKLNNLNERKKLFETYLSKLKNSNSEYISFKKNYEEKSIKSIIDRVLLIYFLDVIEFNDVNVQDVLNDYTKGYGENIIRQNIIINYIYKFLNNNINHSITLIDRNSDDKKEYTYELDELTVKNIKEVLSSLIIKY